MSANSEVAIRGLREALAAIVVASSKAQAVLERVAGELGLERNAGDLEQKKYTPPVGPAWRAEVDGLLADANSPGTKTLLRLEGMKRGPHSGPGSILYSGIPIVVPQHGSRWEGLRQKLRQKARRETKRGARRQRHYSDSDSDSEEKDEPEGFSVEAFKKSLHEKAPFFEELDLKKLGLVLGGGSVYGNATQGEYDDYDIFPIGRDAAAMEANILVLANCLLRWAAKRFLPFAVYRTQSTITFRIGRQKCLKYTVQVILRSYADIAEILYGFDLGSSAFAWDGSDVWVSPLGRLAYTEGVNILNLSRRLPSYEHRIAKYFRRGFALMLPDLPQTPQALDNLQRLQVLTESRGVLNGAPGCILASRVMELTTNGESSYSQQKMPYNDDHALVQRNLDAAEKRLLYLAVGVQRDPDSLDSSLFSIQPAVTARELQEMLGRDFMLLACGSGVAKIKRTAQVFGRQVAGEILAQCTDLKPTDQPYELARAAAEAEGRAWPTLQERCSMAALPCMPYLPRTVFAPAHERTLLGLPEDVSIATKAPMSVSEWYGLFLTEVAAKHAVQGLESEDEDENKCG